MEVQVSIMFNSPKCDLDRSSAHRISAPKSPVARLRGYPELETGAKRSQPAPPALPLAKGGA